MRLRRGIIIFWPILVSIFHEFTVFRHFSACLVVFLFVFRQIVDAQRTTAALKTEMDSTGGAAGLISSPTDLFSRGRDSTGPPASSQRQSPWPPLGPSPRPGGEGPDSAGAGGPSTAAVSCAPAGFSPRVGDAGGPFTAAAAGSRTAGFYDAETETSPPPPPRLATINDYQPSPGKQLAYLTTPRGRKKEPHFFYE